MNKLTLIIDKADTQLTQAAGVLTIKTPDHKETLPFTFLEQVIIYGKTLIAADVLRVLSENNIPTVILPSRGKGEPAWIGAGLAVNTQWRQKQYQAWSFLPAKIALAKELITQKMHAQNQTLKMFGQAEVAIPTLEPISTAQLMGYEGNSARQYFQTLGQAIPAPWVFNGRNRQPPQDPINALLSLSYTLAVSEIKSQIEIAGLDPWLGFIHETYPARPALALDLIEPLRPQIDAWVIQSLQHFQPEQFTQSQLEGCRLTKEGRLIYYALWNQARQNWQTQEQSFTQVLRAQIAQLKTQFTTYLPNNTSTESTYETAFSENAPF